jgi:putative endonuclease
VLVFVEVKTRSSGAFGSPLEAVTARKRLKLVRMALEYVTRSRLSKVACRFDVVGVLRQAGTTRVEVVVDAFSVQD